MLSSMYRVVLAPRSMLRMEPSTIVRPAPRRNWLPAAASLKSSVQPALSSVVAGVPAVLSSVSLISVILVTPVPAVKVKSAESTLMTLPRSRSPVRPDASMRDRSLASTPVSVVTAGLGCVPNTMSPLPVRSRVSVLMPPTKPALAPVTVSVPVPLAAMASVPMSSSEVISCWIVMSPAPVVVKDATALSSGTSTEANTTSPLISMSCGALMTSFSRLFTEVLGAASTVTVLMLPSIRLGSSPIELIVRVSKKR